MCFASHGQWLSVAIMEATQLLPDEKRDTRKEKTDPKNAAKFISEDCSGDLISAGRD
jgi:hypothetical protein